MVAKEQGLSIDDFVDRPGGSLRRIFNRRTLANALLRTADGLWGLISLGVAVGLLVSACEQKSIFHGLLALVFAAAGLNGCFNALRRRGSRSQ